jgi:hypothetical protein
MIIQTNTFICDDCGKIVSVSEKVRSYDDPVVSVPDGWGFNKDDVLICRECLEKET